MTIEQPEPNYGSDNILGWFGESISYFPTFLDDPYETGDFSGDSWWAQAENLERELLSSSPISFNTTTTIATNTSIAPTPTDSIVSIHPEPLDLPIKRKVPDDLNPKVSGKNTRQRTSETDVGSEQVDAAPRNSSTKKKAKKPSGNNNNGSNNKEGRWAEQLLNPCATAVTARNPSRVQHFLYVLHDLSSLSGDANHRLAFYGLRALTHHLSAGTATGSSFSSLGGGNFASSNPKFFRDSLIKFNDINPWFRIPNNVANTSILQILGEQNHARNLHILDIGVSHGVQWPTLLEELTRRTGGPPPLVRLTVVAPPSTDNQSGNSSPFACGPSNFDFSSKLLSFAKDMNVNLQIKKLENFQLQNLNSQVINSSPEEILIICAQFRLHSISHSNPDDRTEFLRVLRNLQPKGVILSENNTDCSCINCGDFATSFPRRVEYLWRFLDSTSAAYKGRECDERRMMEAEAAKVLINAGEMNETKEIWCERMKGAGFKGQVFGEETIDGAKALLRKYDSNWEVRLEEKDGCVGLWWKGQPVSFCSLWKMDIREEDCLM